MQLGAGGGEAKTSTFGLFKYLNTNLFLVGVFDIEFSSKIKPEAPKDIKEIYKTFQLREKHGAGGARIGEIDAGEGGRSREQKLLHGRHALLHVLENSTSGI